MSQEIITTIIAFIGTAVGTLGGIVASCKLTSYRIAQLEKQFSELESHVREHNNFMERIAKLELRDRVQDHRIEDLEDFHKQG